MVTATGQGRVGFIDADDIAAVAVETLIEPANEALVLTGPEALSYDDVAVILSEASGRAIAHRAMSTEDARAGMAAAGIPGEYAGFLAGLEARIAAGADARTTDAVSASRARRRAPSARSCRPRRPRPGPAPAEPAEPAGPAGPPATRR